jgi:hypothetical protein
MAQRIWSSVSVILPRITKSRVVATHTVAAAAPLVSRHATLQRSDADRRSPASGLQLRDIVQSE